MAEIDEVGNPPATEEATQNQANQNLALKEDDDDEVENFPYMNGNSHGAPKKFSPYVIKSQTDRDIIRLIGQQLRIMGLEYVKRHCLI